MAFITGDTVELVPLDPDDETHVETYRRSRNEPAMRATGAYTRGLTHGEAGEDIEEKRARETRDALCAIRVTGDVVGWCVVVVGDERARVAYVGYYVLPEHQNKGYASEATRLPVRHAFREFNAHRVEATVQADNPASERVLEKLGFEQEGTKRDGFYKNGEYKDLTLWSVLEAEFTPA